MRGKIIAVEGVRLVLTVQSEKRFSVVGTFGEIATFGGCSVYIAALL